MAHPLLLDEMEAELLDEIPLGDYLLLVGLPDGSFGISYDISTRNTEDELPYGWHARRAQTYRHLARFLERAQFTRLQKSDWVRNNTSALETFYVMLMLRFIPPPGKFQSTVQGLKMHRIDDWVFDISGRVRIGGDFAPRLAGPTPSRLIPDTVPFVLPPANFQIPAHTRRSILSLDRRNWGVDPGDA